MRTPFVPFIVANSRMLRTSILSIAFMILVMNLQRATHATDDDLEKVIAASRKTADSARMFFRSAKIKTFHEDGKKEVVQLLELEIGKDGFGRERVTNKDGSVWLFAANPKNAFFIIKKDPAVEKWRVQQFSNKLSDAEGYDRLWNAKTKREIDSRIGYEGCRGLLDMWDKKQLQIKSKKKDADGTLSFFFVPSKSASEKLIAWGIKKSRVEFAGEPKTLEELHRRNLEIGPRPVELISVKATVDPKKGYFVTFVESQTGQINGENYTYTFKAEGITAIKDHFHARKTTRQRVSGSHQSETRSEVISAGPDSTIKPTDNQVESYGLKEPKFGKVEIR